MTPIVKSRGEAAAAKTGVRSGRSARRLARYTRSSGLAREIVAIAAAQGSTLVVDRFAAGLGDWRLVAHLAADEPPENAKLVCEMYLADTRHGRCARMSDGDLLAPPLPATEPDPEASVRELRDRQGHVLRLRVLGGPQPRLRWTRSASEAGPDRFEIITVRDAIGALEGYESALTITRQAIQAREVGVSAWPLVTELANAERSPTVLNRQLRTAVLSAIAQGGATMSEIATRCGRIKRDRRGNPSGEANWLARRIGLQAHPGAAAPSPWVHSDTLALIARRGLGLAPVDVEVL